MAVWAVTSFDFIFLYLMDIMLTELNSICVVFLVVH